jgi:hypothetical protein
MLLVVDPSVLICSWIHADVAKMSADAVLRAEDSFGLGARLPAAAEDEIEFRLPLVIAFQALKVVESAILVSICGVHKLVVPLIYLSFRNRLGSRDIGTDISLMPYRCDMRRIPLQKD